jgi:WD40 repeat protein
MRTFALALATAIVAGQARAHHRQTPPVVIFTDQDTGSENGAFLSRNSARDGAFAAVIATPGNQEGRVVRYRSQGVSFSDTTVAPLPDDAGTATFGQPAVSAAGSAVTLVSDGPPSNGRQICLYAAGIRIVVTSDPSGTSENPVLSGNGRLLAFESSGNLAGVDVGPGSPSRQIFTYRAKGPSVDPLTLTQVSRGHGSSAEASLDKTGKSIVFASTSDPLTGADTFVSQIWRASLATHTLQVLTNGQGMSMHPQMSGEGRLVVFQSTADLAGDGTDTGVPQIFAANLKTGFMARITGNLPDDAAGCVDPSVVPYRRDWRIAFLCSGEPHYVLLTTAERYRIVAVAGAQTTRVLAGVAPQFVLLSTTANLLGRAASDLGSGPQVYLLNLFKAEDRVEAEEFAPAWFPIPSIPTAP